MSKLDAVGTAIAGFTIEPVAVAIAYLINYPHCNEKSAYDLARAATWIWAGGAVVVLIGVLKKAFFEGGGAGAGAVAVAAAADAAAAAAGAAEAAAAGVVVVGHAAAAPNAAAVAAGHAAAQPPAAQPDKLSWSDYLKMIGLFFLFVAALLSGILQRLELNDHAGCPKYQAPSSPTNTTNAFNVTNTFNVSLTTDCPFLCNTTAVPTILPPQPPVLPCNTTNSTQCQWYPTEWLPERLPFLCEPSVQLKRNITCQCDRIVQSTTAACADLPLAPDFEKTEDTTDFRDGCPCEWLYGPFGACLSGTQSRPYACGYLWPQLLNGREYTIVCPEWRCQANGTTPANATRPC